MRGHIKGTDSTILNLNEGVSSGWFDWTIFKPVSHSIIIIIETIPPPQCVINYPPPPSPFSQPSLTQYQPFLFTFWQKFCPLSLTHTVLISTYHATTQSLQWNGLYKIHLLFDTDSGNEENIHMWRMRQPKGITDWIRDTCQEVWWNPSPSGIHTVSGK